MTSSLEFMDALEIVLSHVSPIQTHRLAPLAALGSVLAEDVIAPRPHPPFAASIKDGFAVRANDGTRDYEVIGASRAGAPNDATLTNNHAVYITTGAPLPAGADAVVQIEDVLELQNDGNIEMPATPASIRIRLRKMPKAGQDVRPVGSDIAEGSTLLAAGYRLHAAEVGLLCSMGITQVLVMRKPVVAVLSTGDELVDAASSADSPPPSAIFDANRPLLLAAVEELNALPLDLGVLADSAQAVERGLDLALERQADVLICSGGVSMGDKDLVKPVLASRARVHFRQVKLKPGKPLTFATVERTTAGQPHAPPLLVFGLPGNPASSFVCFHLFVAPAMRSLQAEHSPSPRRMIARLATSVKLDAERPEFHRAFLSCNADGLIAHSTGAQISSRLGSCVQANALIELPSAATHGTSAVSAGSVVSVLVIGGLTAAAGAQLDTLSRHLPPSEPVVCEREREGKGEAKLGLTVCCTAEAELEVMQAVEDAMTDAVARVDTRVLASASWRHSERWLQHRAERWG